MGSRRWPVGGGGAADGGGEGEVVHGRTVGAHDFLAVEGEGGELDGSFDALVIRAPALDLPDGGTGKQGDVEVHGVLGAAGEHEKRGDGGLVGFH